MGHWRLGDNGGRDCIERGGDYMRNICYRSVGQIVWHENFGVIVVSWSRGMGVTEVGVHEGKWPGIWGWRVITILMLRASEVGIDTRSALDTGLEDQLLCASFEVDHEIMVGIQPLGTVIQMSWSGLRSMGLFDGMVEEIVVLLVCALVDSAQEEQMVKEVVVSLVCALVGGMESGVMLLSGAWGEVMVKGVMGAVVLLGDQTSGNVDMVGTVVAMDQQPEPEPQGLHVWKISPGFLLFY
ncbi:hypothetical protein HD554DRAFT_2040080 [Boletus coccyginus]|nr:hypothetical protein HD554DRAFT_2040080 [Boletus coccyginus]